MTKISGRRCIVSIPGVGSVDVGSETVRLSPGPIEVGGPDAKSDPWDEAYRAGPAEPMSYVFHPRHLEGHVSQLTIDRWRLETLCGEGALDVEGLETPVQEMGVTEDGVGFKRKPCPSCLKETMVEVIDQMKPTGVSALSTGGFGMEGVVLRSHEECRSCGYNSREAETEVQDERPPTNDDPA